MSKDPLLQPFRLKHLTLRNRIILTSHEPGYPADGMPKEAYRAYHVERAKGGVAMTMTAGSTCVAADSPSGIPTLHVYKDEVVPWLRQMTDEIHEHGAVAMIQISHLGRRCRWDTADWLPIVSPSHKREASHRAFPKKLEDWDIERIIKDYVDAAERVLAGGVDGVEIEAFGHLVDQFWSPATNELDAPYGGSLENRVRFTFEILEGIRKRCGDKFVLGVRQTADERLPGGLSASEGMQIAQMLKDSGLVDYLNIVRGRSDTDAALTDMIPIMGMRSAPHLDFAGEIRSTTQFPTIHAGKIQDVATARHAIAEGKVDLVGLTRAHMADPHIVRKIMEGSEERIRPCVGANFCLDHTWQGGPGRCLHNPSTGREVAMPHDIQPASAKRKVVVVGAVSPVSANGTDLRL